MHEDGSNAAVQHAGVSGRAATAVLIAAAASGQGKTSVTAALARKLRRLGQRVRVFKTGPDFLDPMLLQAASGAPVHNLDLWMVGEQECLGMLAEAAAQADAILVEGVMGLYDGTPSSADLARRFGLPVVAVIDASAMAQTVGALALGLRDYGQVELAGVIANRVAGDGHRLMIAESLRDVPLLATLPGQRMALPERHLGLVPPEEQDHVDLLIEVLADQLRLDEDAWAAVPPVSLAMPASPQGLSCPLQGKTVAIARDAAFAFLYPANVDCLRALGARIVYFSPLADEPVPAGADAVYLPGGYPELHLPALSSGTAWQASLHAAWDAGVPIYAECGGMMAVTESITDAGGGTAAMAGLLAGRTFMQERLAALGPQSWSADAGELRGHAFHYSRLETALAPAAHAVRHPRGEPGEPVYRRGSLTASYFHAYFPSCPAAAAALFLRGGQA